MPPLMRFGRSPGLWVPPVGSDAWARLPASITPAARPARTRACLGVVIRHTCCLLTLVGRARQESNLARPYLSCACRAGKTGGQPQAVADTHDSPAEGRRTPGTTEISPVLEGGGKLHRGRLPLYCSGRRLLFALDPTFTIARFRTGAPSDNPRYRATWRRIRDGLRKVGMPEG